MLKKIEKDFNNIYGIEKLEDNYSFNKPILLTMFPISFNYREINGYFSQLMYLMQIRTINNDSSYSIKDMPFDLITGEFKEKIDEEIIKNIPIGNFLEAKKFMHNINIFSYCDGNNRTAKILNNIYDYLKHINYNQEEINEITKEIFVLQIVDNHLNNESIEPIPYATIENETILYK